MKRQRFWSTAALVSTLAIAGSASSATDSPAINSSLAYYCEYQRICSNQCVEQAYGRHGNYCVRWDYVCRTVCVGGGRPFILRPWRRDYYW